METQYVSYLKLEGSYEEIGRQMAKKTRERTAALPPPQYFTERELGEAIELYKTYCPGLMKELEGYANACNMTLSDIAYTWMTYLTPHCSGLIVEGSLMKDGHTRLIRNYEFSIADEDLMLCETRPEGKYAHIGGSLALFGRTEGINECGLAVSMSSCGFPVSNLEGMRPPKIKGLQFWAVIRSLLENCKDVEEAMELVQKMPIAYNINLYIADSKGNGSIVETMDGEFSFQQISSKSEKKYLCGTNHIVIPTFQKFEPFAMRNSMVRLQTLEHFMEGRKNLEEDEVKKLFLTKYPEGMSAYYYDDWFGTIKSVVMDTANRSFQICWFGQKENGWEEYRIGTTFKEKTLEKRCEREQGDATFFEKVYL
ncbi:C45 family autoproteolytic acyltransferase/hydolase [Clostridiisalibacter paucivorans]|uniref:C45 family autoproteolytic acyltransferase/hydolase n=1 Tax=Clostridiisalibacter paucivorans TaxID=408753 RepID=UPI00068635DF|nr:C45 family peptidase [Clostridiisalibacter paucivorans]